MQEVNCFAIEETGDWSVRDDESESLFYCRVEFYPCWYSAVWAFAQSTALHYHCSNLVHHSVRHYVAAGSGAGKLVREPCVSFLFPCLSYFFTRFSSFGNYKRRAFVLPCCGLIAIKAKVIFTINTYPGKNGICSGNSGTFVAVIIQF